MDGFERDDAIRALQATRDHFLKEVWEVVKIRSLADPPVVEAIEMIGPPKHKIVWDPPGDLSFGSTSEEDVLTYSGTIFSLSEDGLPFLKVKIRGERRACSQLQAIAPKDHVRCCSRKSAFAT